MATVDILHPLNGDTVTPNFTVLTAYAGFSAFTKTGNTITCTVTGLPDQTKPAPNTSGELAFDFTGATPGSTVSITATWVQDATATDTESNVIVENAPLVIVMPPEGPTLLPAGESATLDTNKKYKVTVNCRDPLGVNADRVRVRGRKLNPGQRGNGNGQKWTEVGSASPANPQTAETNVFEVMIPNGDATGHLNFEATRRINGNEHKASKARPA